MGILVLVQNLISNNKIFTTRHTSLRCIKKKVISNVCNIYMCLTRYFLKEAAHTNVLTTAC